MKNKNMHLVLNVLKRLALCGVVIALAACGGGGNSPPPVVVDNHHAIGGAISGLTGTVELQNNGGDTLSASTDGPFTFATAVEEGGAYAITVTRQPVGQTCSVNHGSGTVGTGAVTNVAVVCAANAYPVGGSVSNLSGSLRLQNNGADDLLLSANGSFTFPTAVAHGASYNVTVHTQPVGETCTVGNGSGTLGAAAVSNVAVTCHGNSYTVGGTVTGLVGSLLLRNNADTLTQSSDGSFTFSTPVASGASYSVTVSAPPATQTCTVNNGSGSAVSSNITNVTVNCATNTASLSVGANITIPVGATGSLNVRNVGSARATNVVATLPGGWTGVTQDASTCASIEPGSSCTLSFTSATAYVANGAVAIRGSNTNTVNTAMAFSVGGYLVFDVTGPGAGLVIDSADLAAARWSNVSMLTNATHMNDGVANTDAIIASSVASGSVAEACRSNTQGGHSWSLPAMCQVDSRSNGCTANLPSIYTHLAQHGFGAITPGIYYWTSTEYDQNYAYIFLPYDPQGPNVSIKASSLLRSRCIAPVSW